VRVLFGCEESAKGREAFARLGHDAWSCDLLPSRVPGNHLQCDIMGVLDMDWDLIILHPDCTAMAVCGNKKYAFGKPGYIERVNAVDWTRKLWDKAVKHCAKVALENPASVIFPYLTNVQYVQPWMFGHGETKKTGLALHNLPHLVPTNIVDGREQRIWKMPPGPNRKRDRSESYQGIMDAMAEQWGTIP
jgi:hypothetical protein